MTIQLSPYTARKYNVGTLNLNLNAIDIEQIEVLPDNWEGWENGEPTQWTGVRRWVYEFKAKFFDNP